MICNLLKIKSGIIAITKTDLVEKERLELVEEDVRNFVQGTFLKGAAIVPVSSKTMFHIDLLKEKVKESTSKIESKPANGLFRLPIDRVFTLKGFGTVFGERSLCQFPLRYLSMIKGGIQVR
jgi:selenocysteine-specific elongation factor